MIVVCQSVGAAGFASSTVTGVAAGAAATGGLIGGLWPGDEKNETEASEGTPKEPKDNNKAYIEAEKPSKKEKDDFEEDATIENDETEVLFIVKDNGTIYITKRQKTDNEASNEENTHSKEENETLFEASSNEDYGLSLKNDGEIIVSEEGTQTETSLPIIENNEKLSLHLDVRTPIGWGISAGLDSTRGSIKQAL